MIDRERKGNRYLDIMHECNDPSTQTLNLSEQLCYNGILVLLVISFLVERGEVVSLRCSINQDESLINLNNMFRCSEIFSGRYPFAQRNDVYCMVKKNNIMKNECKT